MPRYCAREGISIASYHRWRRLLAAPTRCAMTTSEARAAPAFVDLSALTGAGSRLELRLDLGGGVILQIARG